MLLTRLKNNLYNTKPALCLFLIFISEIASAQDPMFSQFMFKQLYFNPANAGTTATPRLIGGYRNQWPGMNNAFSTYYLSYDQKINSLKSGIGISVMRDNIGNSVFNVTGFDFNYNYQTELTREINISFGISAGLYQKALHSGNVILPDQSPFQSGNSTAVIPGENRWYPDFAFGIHTLMKKGIGCP